MPSASDQPSASGQLSASAPPSRVRHDRDDVVAAALGLLDRVGLPDLTMRRLAATLGVQPSALYRHFASKQALLAALADRITAEGEDGDEDPSAEDGGPAAPDPDGTGAPVAPRPAEAAAVDPAAAAARLRAELLAHRDGAEVVASTFALGLGDGAPLGRLTRAFRGAGLPKDQAAGAGATLLHFVLGSVQLEQQRRQAAELGIRVALEPPGGFGLGVDLIVRGARTLAGSGR